MQIDSILELLKILLISMSQSLSFWTLIMCFLTTLCMHADTTIMTNVYILGLWTDCVRLVMLPRQEKITMQWSTWRERSSPGVFLLSYEVPTTIFCLLWVIQGQCCPGHWYHSHHYTIDEIQKLDIRYSLPLLSSPPDHKLSPQVCPTWRVSSRNCLLPGGDI